jgi:hypothetical protein
MFRVYHILVGLASYSIKGVTLFTLAIVEFISSRVLARKSLLGCLKQPFIESLRWRQVSGYFGQPGRATNETQRSEVAFFFGVSSYVR